MFSCRWTCKPGILAKGCTVGFTDYINVTGKSTMLQVTETNPFPVSCPALGDETRPNVRLFGITTVTIFCIGFVSLPELRRPMFHMEPDQLNSCIFHRTGCILTDAITEKNKKNKLRYKSVIVKLIKLTVQH